MKDISKQFLQQMKRAAPYIKTYRRMGKFSIGDIVKIVDSETLKAYNVSADDLFIIFDIIIRVESEGVTSYGLYHLKDGDFSAWHEETALELEMSNEEATDYVL